MLNLFGFYIFGFKLLSIQYGLACDIVTLDVPGEGMLYADCYLVSEGIFYMLQLAYGEEDAAYAETLLHQWADMFP